MTAEAKPSPSRLARLADVAARAGVSTATADRALHRRPGVRPATLRRVLAAAAELDYAGPDEASDPLPEPPFRVVVLLPEGTNAFLALLGRRLAVAADLSRGSGMRWRVEHVEGFRPEVLAKDLLRLGGDADGVVVMALEHPAVRDAVAQLTARGVPVVTLISDLGNSARCAYVGLDNRAAGRTAAWLLGRFIGARPAKVAMIAGSLSYRAHEEREIGFLGLLREQFPAVEVVGLREGQDDDARNHRQTRTLLGRHPDLAGIYNLGGGSEGVARALREVQRVGAVSFIGHGLTPGTRTLLIEGAMDAIITQDVGHAVRSCMAVFANIRAGRDPSADVEPARCEIVLRENLP